MNRSYSKIRHIQKINILLEHRILSEGHLLKKYAKDKFSIINDNLSHDGVVELENLLQSKLTEENTSFDGDMVKLKTTNGEISLDEIIDGIIELIEYGSISDFQKFKTELFDGTSIFYKIDDIVRNYKIGEAPGNTKNEDKDEEIVDLDTLLKSFQDADTKLRKQEGGEEAPSEYKSGEIRTNKPSHYHMTGWEGLRDKPKQR
jgi:hypothetical protein